MAWVIVRGLTAPGLRSAPPGSPGDGSGVIPEANIEAAFTLIGTYRAPRSVRRTNLQGTSVCFRASLTAFEGGLGSMWNAPSASGPWTSTVRHAGWLSDSGARGCGRDVHDRGQAFFKAHGWD